MVIRSNKSWFICMGKHKCMCRMLKIHDSKICGSSNTIYYGTFQGTSLRICFSQEADGLMPWMLLGITNYFHKIFNVAHI